MTSGRLIQALKTLFNSKGVKDKERFDSYLELLELCGIDEEKLIKKLLYFAMTWKSEYGNKIPDVSDIIGREVASDKTAELENAWMEFKKTCCNKYKMEPIPDWVYTIKKQIGIAEVEDRSDDNEKWVKKEFMRIYPAVKSGGIKVIQEPVVYEVEGGPVIASPRQKSSDQEKLIDIGVNHAISN